MTDGGMLFSVVIPVKNGVDTLGRTLDALRAQSHRAIQIIIIDGGSTDGTLELIDSFAMPNVELLSDAGGGITSAVNIGIRKARGEFVLPWMCADDYLDPGFLEATARGFASADIGFVYGNWRAIEKGTVVKSCRPAQDWQRTIRYCMPAVLPNSFAFRRAVFERLGYLDETLRYSNDYDFLRRIVDADIRGHYCGDAWYYYQLGGLSARRQLECQREVVRSAIAHGSPRIAVYAAFLRIFVLTKLSFLLNRVRWYLRRK